MLSMKRISAQTLRRSQVQWPHFTKARLGASQVNKVLPGVPNLVEAPGELLLSSVMGCGFCAYAPKFGSSLQETEHVRSGEHAGQTAIRDHWKLVEIMAGHYVPRADNGAIWRHASRLA